MDNKMVKPESITNPGITVGPIFTLPTYPATNTPCQLLYPSLANHPRLDSPRSRISSDPAPALSLLFTHGSRSGNDHPAIVGFLAGFAQTNSALVWSGEDELFPRVLTFHSVVAQSGHINGAIGGRSFGSRAAVRAGLYSKNKTLILLSYPLHREINLRHEELLNLPNDVDVIFISGTKDPMCAEPILHLVRSRMKAKSWYIKVVGGDHSMKISEASEARQVLCLKLRVKSWRSGFTGDSEP